jgi:beta-glucanase (GH16 family)
MRKLTVAPIAILASTVLLAGVAPTDAPARQGDRAASSPARSDATAALAAARAAVSAAGVSGLLSIKHVRFTFASSPGTCPPGTANASYCLGGTGSLDFSLVLRLRGHRGAVPAATTQASIVAGAAVPVSAGLDHNAFVLLRYARAHRDDVSATLKAEAILSAATYYTAKGTVMISYVAASSNLRTVKRQSPRPRSARAAAGVLTVGVALGLTAVAAHGAAAKATIVSRAVARPGNYTVFVLLPPTPGVQTADISIAGQMADNVPVGTGESTAFFVHTKTRRLVVRIMTATGMRVKPQLAVASSAAAVDAPASGPYRNLVFSDVFTGPATSAADPSHWAFARGGTCGLGTQSTDTSSLSNASLDGLGDLAITAVPYTGSTGTAQYTTAELSSNGLYSFTYGEVEARIRLPVGSGLCPAFWLLQSLTPGEHCPTTPCPELDIMENISPYPNVAWADLHGPGQGSYNQQYMGSVTAATSLEGSWHTYGVIWAPGRVTWTLDGLPYATATPSSLVPGAQWAFDGLPMSIILDLAVGGWPGPPTSTSGFPATMLVRWVRVYQ